MRLLPASTAPLAGGPGVVRHGGCALWSRQSWEHSCRRDARKTRVRMFIHAPHSREALVSRFKIAGSDRDDSGQRPERCRSRGDGQWARISALSGRRGSHFGPIRSHVQIRTSAPRTGCMISVLITHKRTKSDKKLYGFTSSTFTRVHAAHPRCDRAATQMAERSDVRPHKHARRPLRQGRQDDIRHHVDAGEGNEQLLTAKKSHDCWPARVHDLPRDRLHVGADNLVHQLTVPVEQDGWH